MATTDVNPVWAAAKPFVTGSISGCMATCCIQPIDMVKVRIQLNASAGNSVSPVTVFSDLVKSDGFFSLYRGLSAGLTRQVVYTGARLGLYDIFTEKAKAPGESKLPTWKVALCALSAGGIAAVIGNPADLSLIRMQADSMLPVDQRRGYKHVGNALTRIVGEEGFMALFQGAAPTAVRAMSLNLGMLAINTKAKDALGDMGVKGAPQVFGASAIAGFFAAFFSLPFDFIKTQMQQMKPNAEGKMPFTGTIDCGVQTFKIGGITRFWAGFPTYYFRIAPHAMVTLIAQDKVKQAWKSMNL
eukprot:GEMP01058854.1.p1 GENE.GEMP01058854.1~~GEMP01058854.1.p1  ORF type:complete len:300 (+),score=64.05 GEMP01058854.1:41-940(+)